MPTIIEDKQDLENLQKLIKYKNDLTTSIGIDNFIKKVSEIIDQSEYLSFKREQSRKFINRDRPIFILKVNDELNKKYSTMNYNDPKVADKITDEITEMIKDSITSKVSEFIMDHIKNDEKLNKYFNSFDESLKNLCISNIYGIRVNIDNNIIYLEYLR